MLASRTRALSAAAARLRDRPLESGLQAMARSSSGFLKTKENYHAKLSLHPTKR
jgi:hypothetical protein